MTNPQTEVLKTLLNGKSLTHFQSIRKWSYYRLSSAINRIRNAGFNVRTEMIERKNGSPYARYTLLVLLMALSFSCTTPTGEKRVEKDGYSVVTIDGCEYIEVTFCAGCNNGYYSLTHKGNCSNPIHK